jgi:hypothetical protein
MGWKVKAKPLPLYPRKWDQVPTVEKGVKIFIIIIIIIIIIIKPIILFNLSMLVTCS